MKIAFVVEDIYPALNPSFGGAINGRSVHLKNLGAALRDAGADVSFITMDHGQADGEVLEGMKVYKMYSEAEGIPGLRFPLVKMPKLIGAMDRADADIYVFMCPDPFVGVIGWYCRREQKKFIYYGASDRDFEKNSWKMSFRDYKMFVSGLRKADIVLCQNGHQKNALSINFKKEGVVLHNPMPSAENTYSPSGKVAWVANYRPLKRPEMFIRLADQVSEDLVMVGGYTTGCTEADYEAINHSAEKSGIKALGALTYAEADSVIAGSKLLVSTASFEGLSNTFLQAWRRGIPVVSFVDPDDMIKENGLGEVVRDFEELVRAVEKFSKGISQEESANIKSFFDRTFTPEIIAERFKMIVKRLSD